MLDDAKVDARLIAAGERVMTRPVARASQVVDLESRSRVRGDRRSLRIGAAALAVGVAAGTFAIVSRHDAGPVVHVQTTPSVPSGAAEVDKDGLPLELPGISKQQMRAHLGLDVPSDWQPIDFGQARIWAPPVYDTSSASGVGRPVCTRSTPGEVNATTAQRIDVQFRCPATGNAAANRVLLTPLPKLDGRNQTTITVNGYRLQRFAKLAGVSIWASRELGIELQGSGPHAETVMKTLAPSARRVVAANGREPTPVAWRNITVGTARFSIPSTWPIDHSGIGACSSVEGLTIGPILTVLHCKYVPSVPFKSAALIEPNFDTVRETVSDVSIDMPLAKQDFIVYFGTDGRVARAIRQSAHVATDAGSGADIAVDGCPGHPAVRSEQFPKSTTQLVPDDLISAIACVYEFSGRTALLRQVVPVHSESVLPNDVRALQNELLAGDHPQNPRSCPYVPQWYLSVVSRRYGQLILSTDACGTTNGDHTENHNPLDAFFTPRLNLGPYPHLHN